jgi:hypothetical protein
MSREIRQISYLVKLTKRSGCKNDKILDMYDRLCFYRKKEHHILIKT